VAGQAPKLTQYKCTGCQPAAALWGLREENAGLSGICSGDLHYFDMYLHTTNSVSQARFPQFGGQRDMSML